MNEENIRVSEDGIILTINVIPRSKKSEIKVEGNQIIVKVTAPPTGGRANREVIEILADFLQIKKRHLEIISGEKSRVKKILIRTHKREVDLESVKRKFSLN